MPSEMTLSDRIDVVYAARRENQHDVAHAHAMAAVAQGRHQGPKELLARALCAYGQVERDAGAPQVALPAYREAVDLLAECGPPLVHAHALRHLADLYMEMSDLANAGSAMSTASELFAAHEDAVEPLNLANMLRSYALLCEQLGQETDARQYWSRARVIYEEVRVEEGIRECDAHLSSSPSCDDG